MTKRTRTILFFICVFLFLLVTPVAVFYSQGYRFDFENKKFSQTGGLFLKIEPKQAEIYFDGQLTKKTDFFFGSALIENLLPKKYKVLVKKDGYQNWEKNLEVKEKGVTEAKNIFLVPENQNFQILVKGVKDLFLASDGRKMVLKKEKDYNPLATSSPSPTGERAPNDWYLTLFDLERNVESFLIGGKDFSKKQVDFLNLQWFLDSKKIILEVAVGEEQRYFIFELDKPFPVSPISLDLKEVPEKISFNPQDSQKLFFLRENNLFEINYKTKEISEPILTNLITYEISNSGIFFLDSSGFLFTTDLSGKTQEKMNIEPFPIKEEVYYQIFLKLPEIFLKEENSLFSFESESKSFKKIFEPVKEIKFSDDLKKMMFFNDYEVWIVYLEDILEQPSKKVGELQLIARFSEKIDNVFWITNHYLIFNLGDKIKIAEIDDRDKIQIWDLVSIKEPKIFWNQNSKELYILSKENLYKSEKIIK